MQKTLNSGVVVCNSMKRLIRDLAPFKQIDCITNDRELSRLQRYPRYRQAYQDYRAMGGHPDTFGVLVAHSENQEQFFLLPKEECDSIIKLMSKKLSELTPEERCLMIDESNESLVEV